MLTASNLMDHFFIKLLHYPFGFGLRDFLNKVVDLIAETLNLFVPLRKNFSS